MGVFFVDHVDWFFDRKLLVLGFIPAFDLGSAKKLRGKNTPCFEF